ncbi:MAG: T9SS type A sorting domain-containing protein [Bacteroidales bacterium]|nr:T9SS type A sorting domain-containing protein [Bacteroidales bacterium]MBP3254821.1 T9SS type A sorting domain-containing protein [Bacteroidales bacterium]
MKTLKFFVALCSAVLCFGAANAQLTVTELQGKSVATVVEQYLIGDNIELVSDEKHPATFNGQTTINSNAIGYFKMSDTSGCQMGIDEGVVIATCAASLTATGQNPLNGNPTPPRTGNDVQPEYYATYYKYCKQNGKSPSNMYDVASLEFWIKPKIDNFAFFYSFASMEYPSFVYQQFNDYFGFYMSGPYDEDGNFMPGSAYLTFQNIALIPGTQIPVMINTVNSHASNPSYPQYHVPNCSGKYCPFNAYTVRLQTAPLTVIPGAYYKIEVDISDIGDGSYNSALYLGKDTRKFDNTSFVEIVCDDIDLEDLMDVKNYFDHDVKGVVHDIDHESDGEPVKVSWLKDNATGKVYDTVIINNYQLYTFTDTLTNASGGDSIVVVYKFLRPSDETIYQVTLKEGEYLDINGFHLENDGVFSQTLINQYGCDSTIVYVVEWGDSSYYYIVDPYAPKDPQGIDDAVQAERIRMFPNPAHGNVNVTGLLSQAQLTFCDMNGRTVLQTSLNANQTKVDISSLAQGAYTVLIKTKQSVKAKRLIVR